MFLKPLLASSLPPPEETTTNLCVFPTQGPSQTHLLSRTHCRQQVLVFLTALRGLFHFTTRNNHPSG